MSDAAETAGQASSRRRWRLLRALALVAALGLFAMVLVHEWAAARHSLGDLSPRGLALAMASGLSALCCSALAWRTILADLGSPLGLKAVARIYFVGQLAKYVPGSVWIVLAQIELGRDHGVPAKRSGTASLLLYPVTVCAGATVGLLAIPSSMARAPSQMWMLLAALPVALVLLHPRVLGPGLGRLLKLARREQLERLPSSTGLAKAWAWSVVGFVLMGLHVAVIAVDLGAADGGVRLLLLAAGAISAAWTLGFLVVLAPGGAGVRELALVGLLSPMLGPGEAAVLALASRLTLVLADGLVAGLAGYVGRRSRR